MAVSISTLKTNFERITDPVTDFIRGNPVTSGITVGTGAALATVAVAGIAKRRKTTKTKKKKAKTTKRRRRKSTTKTKRKRTRKKTKAQIKAMRLRNLAKARRARKTGKRRRVIRGRGLGTHEIRHSGKSTKGKFKVVSFRDKRTGKLVRFKAKR